MKKNLLLIVMFTFILSLLSILNFANADMGNPIPRKIEEVKKIRAQLNELEEAHNEKYTIFVLAMSSLALLCLVVLAYVRLSKFFYSAEDKSIPNNNSENINLTKQR